MHLQTQQTCKERRPHKSTVPYLSEHSEAFKYNVADLNTVCYSVKLREGGGGTIKYTFKVLTVNSYINSLTVERSGSSTELE